MESETSCLQWLCVPFAVSARKCAKSLRAKNETEIVALKSKFGDDRKKWFSSLYQTEEIEKYCGKENAFVFWVKIEEIEGKKIRFTMRLSYESPEFSAIIKNYGEKADTRKCQHTWTLGSYEEEIADSYDDCIDNHSRFSFLRNYIEAWAYSPDVWKTARNRKIENIINEIQTCMDDAIQASPFCSHVAVIPKKCFAFLFWDAMNVIPFYSENEDVLPECDKIKTSTSREPVMMVKFEIGKVGEGLKVTGYMPVPFDPEMFFDFSKFFEQSEKRILFDMTIPEDKFATEEEISNYIGNIKKYADVCGVEVAEKVIKEYGLWYCVPQFERNVIFGED